MIWSVRVGRFTMFAIKDGVYHTDPRASFPDSDSAVWDGEPLTEDGKLGVEIGCFLVSDGDRIFMVDSGLGRWPDAPEGVRAATGMMPAALETLGIEPKQVEMVIHTHLHADHFGGDVNDDAEPFFPNARVVAHGEDLEYFRDAQGWLGDRVRKEFLPLVRAGLVDLVDAPQTLVPGVAVEMAPGHTPGHMSVLISSGEAEALVTGDVMHHPVQVRHTDWNWEADLDPEAAAATRAATVQRLARSKGILAANHFPAPRFGRVEGRNGMMRFEPLSSAVAILNPRRPA